MKPFRIVSKIVFYTINYIKIFIGAIKEMATIKISELFPIEGFEPDDLLEVVQDGKSRRASLEQLDEYMGSNLPITTEEDAGDLLQVDENGKWNKSKLIDKPNGIAPLDNSGKIPSKNLPLDVSTIINETSTDSTVPTSKAVYDFIKNNPEIPIIKIEASQMISVDTIQFTEKQWEVLTNNETKILFADVRDAREEYNAYYRILYKCGDYENISSNDGSLYYEIIGNSSNGFGLIDYRLNGEERQLKMWSDFLPFMGDVNTGDMLKLEDDTISKAIPDVDYATPEYVQAQIQSALYVDGNSEVE